MRHLSTFVLLLCFCCPADLSAQPSVGFRLGAGLSVPSVTVMPNGYDDWSPESKPGAIVGMFVQLPLKNNWLFVPAVQLSSKGFKERHTSSSYGYNFTSSSVLNYLELPLMFVHASRKDGSGFQAGGGPVVGLLLSDTYNYMAKNWDVGLNGQVGYQTPIGFSVQLGFTFGLVNVGQSFSFVHNIKNRFLALTVGYMF